MSFTPIYFILSVIYHQQNACQQRNAGEVVLQPPDLLGGRNGALAAPQRDVKKLHDIPFGRLGEVDAGVGHGVDVQRPQLARCRRSPFV